MPAIDWATPLAAHDAALASASGADLTVGQSIRAEIARLGGEYNSRYSSAVATARVAWVLQADAAHTAADEACRYVENEAGALGAALAFDAFSSAAIKARIKNALALARALARPALTASLLAHSQTIDVAFAAGNAASAAYARSSNNAVSSVRDLEVSLVAALAKSTDWLALVAYS